ncbi:hypothetical protein DEVEQU_00675 [Devosia equisanguinis]|uniref:DUF6460 domain-containing protein n=1 Tax=Devosia equisanguinis TaxID=2490941 RepID=A0A3S4GFS7_9HYPH|nr:DUF6460 domain-containing protein [Devosia equisanguinis]VDS03551.1 hypothetical protein DEVEQU_00675 [Devosia equisanguinis]
MTEDYRPEQRSPLVRFMGGSPVAVIIRLLLLSLVVGFIMSFFDLNVGDLVRTGMRVFRDALRDGFGMFRGMGGYILTGAAVVVPIWLIMRLTRAR